MKPIPILVDSFADADGLNAQMINARDIISRLDPERFHVSTFSLGKPDERLSARPATRLIQLPPHRQTPRILNQFLWGRHQILFYLKASPAARIYLALRSRWRDRRVVIGTVESQSDLQNEPTMKPEQISLWEKTILRSDFLFSNSQSVKESLEREYSLPSEIIPTGVDAKFFVPAWDRPRNARPRVLFVGSLRPFKKPDLVVRAASRFDRADFIIAGDGVMASELRTMVGNLRLSNITFTGNLNRCALREQYQACDLFLFPSIWEGSPKVILEAAACGMPVIARRDYRPETVVDGKTGYLGSSEEELLAGVETLLTHDDLRAEMSRASRALSETFDWDLITRRWEDVFLRLAPATKSKN